MKALVESVDDQDIVDQVQMRIEHHAREVATTITNIKAPFAAVQFDRQPDASWKPVGVWFATTLGVQCRMLPGDGERDWFRDYWLEQASKPIMPDGTQGDWQDWLQDACWRLTNGHTRMLVACVPDLTLDATYRREVAGEEAS